LQKVKATARGEEKLKLTIEIDHTPGEPKALVTVRKAESDSERARMILSYPFPVDQARIVVDSEIESVLGAKG
jgi:hypothetical protein